VPLAPTRHSIVDFLKLGGITYVNGGRIGRELRAGDLGAEITKLKFKLFDLHNLSPSQ
jgi:hypothetical protein